jgi:hypothetical protein
MSYLVGGINEYGRCNLGRGTAAVALSSHEDGSRRLHGCQDLHPAWTGAAVGINSMN